jgi:hypothetical protein
MDYDDDILHMLIRHMENCQAQAAAEGSNAQKGATENRHHQRSLTRLTSEAISDQNPLSAARKTVPLMQKEVTGRQSGSSENVHQTKRVARHGGCLAVYRRASLAAILGR